MGAERINLSVFRAINNLAGKNELLDALMVFCAKYLVFLFLFCLIFFWFVKKGAYKKAVLFSLMSAVIGSGINILIRLFYFHPRPFMLNTGTILIKHNLGSSFPSAHTTLMLCIAFVFLYYKETRTAGLILSLFGLIGGMARVFCGVHFPFDVFGSIILTTAVSLFVYKIREKIKRIFSFLGSFLDFC